MKRIILKPIAGLYLACTAIFLLFSSSTCDGRPEYRDIYLYNDTDEPVYMWRDRFDDDVKELMPHDIFQPDILRLNLIEPGRCYRGDIYTYMDLDVKLIRNYQFLIFKKSTIDKYGIEGVIENDIYDARLKYTYLELQNMGFEIHYSGN